jgi:hypothetical protein
MEQDLNNESEYNKIIADYTAALAIKPNFYNALVWRGLSDHCPIIVDLELP